MSDCKAEGPVFLLDGEYRGVSRRLRGGVNWFLGFHSLRASCSTSDSESIGPKGGAESSIKVNAVVVRTSGRKSRALALTENVEVIGSPAESEAGVRRIRWRARNPDPGTAARAMHESGPIVPNSTTG